jgi:two-component system chemotaxis response regulator CheV
MAMGRSVGVDAYVAKFDAGVLSSTLRPLLARQTSSHQS